MTFKPPRAPDDNYRARVRSPAGVDAGEAVPKPTTERARTRSRRFESDHSRRTIARRARDDARRRVGGGRPPGPSSPSSRPTSTDPSRAQVAVRAAKEGGAVMARKVGAAVIKTKANARDLLTEVDGEVQRIIEARVAEAFPQHGFLVR